jgi:hypothetical protein
VESTAAVVAGVVCLLGLLWVGVVAIRRNLDVKATFRAPFVSLSFEAKERRRRRR